MIQEIEVEAGRERISFKQLRLIPPEVARGLGLGAEAPVFVSSAVEDATVCKDCGIEYKPLVYQVGAVVKAHHFHGMDGGIYYNDYPSHFAEYIKFLDGRFGDWVAVIEPVGLEGFDFFGSNLGKRSEQVKIVGIKAFCIVFACRRDLNLGELKKGFVVTPHGDSDRLDPVCSLEEHPDYADRARFRFKITEDGPVLFSQL